MSVGRRQAVDEQSASLTADLLELYGVRDALLGADVVHLVAGVPYSTKVWVSDWLRIVRYTVEAATDAGAHLVYFDNVCENGTVAPEQHLTATERAHRGRWITTGIPAQLHLSGGATDASDHAKKRGLIEQARHDHLSSASALVHDLQHRARETNVTEPHHADQPTPAKDSPSETE